MSKRQIIVTGKQRSRVDLDLFAQAILALLDEQLQAESVAEASSKQHPAEAEPDHGAGDAA